MRTALCLSIAAVLVAATAACGGGTPQPADLTSSAPATSAPAVPAAAPASAAPAAPALPGSKP